MFQDFPENDQAVLDLIHLLFKNMSELSMQISFIDGQTFVGSKKAIKALNSRSKFLSLVHISGWRDGKDCELVIKGEGLAGNGYPGLSGEEDGSVTGFSRHSKARFWSMWISTPPFSKAFM